MYHANVNLDLMKRNVVHINGGIKINVYVSVENVIYIKKIIFRILIQVVVKMENIYQVVWMIQQLHVIELLKKKQKQLEQILMKKKNAIFKTKSFCILLAFLLITITLLIAVRI